MNVRSVVPRDKAGEKIAAIKSHLQTLKHMNSGAQKRQDALAKLTQARDELSPPPRHPNLCVNSLPASRSRRYGAFKKGELAVIDVDSLGWTPYMKFNEFMQSWGVVSPKMVTYEPTQIPFLKRL